jgi:GNAT superfamily N-acetyltransferase
VARRIADLGLDTLGDLPEACRSCVFWEVGSARRGPAGAPGAAGKEAWVQATQLEWGAPGKVLYLDDEAIGYALFAPPAHLPRGRVMDRSPSEDAILLATLWIDPEQRDAGLAKVLLIAILREVHKRGARALEAYGVRGGVLPATCVLPEGLLTANGFEVLHDDPQLPLLRLDMRKTVRWTESMSHALEGVRSALSGRERAPAPARPAPNAATSEGTC